MLYFDHNATTPIAPEVAEAFITALRNVPGNPSSTHRAGQLARQELERARIGIARNLHCSPAELVFTSGGTESNNLAVLGLVRNTSGAHKHVIVTNVEHPAVLEPVHQLEREGVEVTFARPNLAEIVREIRPETVLISAMHANNETGAVLRLVELGSAVREKRAAGQGIYLHSDGVQALGKLSVDFSRLNVDLYSLSAHKIYGPKGVGGLFIRNGTAIRGIQLGGRHERNRRAGTENVAGAVAFARAVELLPLQPASELALMRDRFERQILGALSDVSVNGCTEERLPNTSNLLFHGLSGEMMLIALDTAGFAVSTGSACSSGSIEPSHVLLAMGLSVDEARASVRFSFGRTNTTEEVDLLSEAVIATVRRFSKSKEQRPQLVAH